MSSIFLPEFQLLYGPNRNGHAETRRENKPPGRQDAKAFVRGQKIIQIRTFGCAFLLRASGAQLLLRGLASWRLETPRLRASACKLFYSHDRAGAASVVATDGSLRASTAAPTAAASTEPISTPIFATAATPPCGNA